MFEIDFRRLYTKLRMGTEQLCFSFTNNKKFILHLFQIKKFTYLKYVVGDSVMIIMYPVS